MVDLRFYNSRWAQRRRAAIGIPDSLHGWLLGQMVAWFGILYYGLTEDVRWYVAGLVIFGLSSSRFRFAGARCRALEPSQPSTTTCSARRSSPFQAAADTPALPFRGPAARVWRERRARSRRSPATQRQQHGGGEPGSSPTILLGGHTTRSASCVHRRRRLRCSATALGPQVLVGQRIRLCRGGDVLGVAEADPRHQDGGPRARQEVDRSGIDIGASEAARKPRTRASATGVID